MKRKKSLPSIVVMLAVLGYMAASLSRAQEATETIVEKYEKLNYDQMRTQLQVMAEQFSHVMKLESAEDKLGIPYQVECDPDRTTKCVLDIVTITDFTTSSQDKVQVLFTGALAGQERLGSQIAYYLIEYLVSNYGKDVAITQLLQTREIVIVPMPNAWGFANDKQKELVPTSSTRFSYKDAFRDFPYNQSPNSCLSTVAARSLYKLMVSNLFVSAATFGSGDENVVINHPWGSINHRVQLSNGQYVSREAPDFKAFEALGLAMQEEAGEEMVFPQLNKTIKKYGIDSVTTSTFASQGSLTDWGYGAGWDLAADAAQEICVPSTYPELPEDFFTSQTSEHVRTAFYRIETDQSDDPDEALYGSRLKKLFDSDDDKQQFQVTPESVKSQDSSNTYDGLINRNLRLAMAMVDMSKPYIMVEKIEKVRIEGSDRLQIDFSLNGCVNVTQVMFSINGTEQTMNIDDAYCNYLIPVNKTQSTFQLKVGSIYDQVVLKAIVDQEWGTSVNPDNVGPITAANDPQTHFVRLRQSEEYSIEHEGKFIKGSRQISYNVSQLLSIAFEKGSLTSGEILDIIVDDGPAPVESELEADFYASDTSKLNVGTFRVIYEANQDESDVLKEIQLELRNDFIQPLAQNGDLCALLVTQYGDLRTFVSSADQESIESYGTTQKLTEDFTCINSAPASNEISQYTLTKGFNYSQDDLKTLNGKGLLLRNLSQESSVSIAYAIIRQRDYEPALDEPAQDVIALCEHPDRLSVLLQSQVAQDDRVMSAYYLPLTKPLLKTLETTEIIINIEGFERINITSVDTNEDLCSSFNQTFTTLTDSFTYQAQGMKAEIHLRQEQVTQVVTGGVSTDEIIYTTLYDQDPITCTFGLANPNYSLTQAVFCSELVTDEFVQEVIEEIDIENGVISELELEAELIVFGQTKGQIGSLKISRKSNSAEEKFIRLELDNNFIDRNANLGSICSLRVTEYGDMRSFIGIGIASESYGTSEDLVEYFDCLDANEIGESSRSYDLSIKSTFSIEKFKTLAGKGLLLKNIDLDKTLTFGIFNRKDDEYLTIPSDSEITALCQDEYRISVLFYSDLQLSDNTLYAYYQPLTKPLLETLAVTSINVKIEGLQDQWVTYIEEDDNFCASFNKKFSEVDQSSTITQAALGKSAEVYLLQRVDQEVIDTTTGQKTVNTQTYKLYENDPIKCSFGLRNPSFSLDRQEYCELVQDPFIIDEIKQEREDEIDPDPVDPDEGKVYEKIVVQSIESELLQNNESRSIIGSFITRFYNDSSVEMELNILTYFASANAQLGDRCSMRLTQFGDMRSFISNTAESNSYGNSNDIAEYFNCLKSADNFINDSRRMQQTNGYTQYILTPKQGLNIESLKNSNGQGVILKNFSADKTLGYGITVDPKSDASLSNVLDTDVAAVCQDEFRLSIMFFTDLSKSKNTLYAYYQPLVKSLIQTIDATSVNVAIDDDRAIKVSDIETNEDLCSSFFIQYSRFEVPLGQTARVSLEQTVTSQVLNPTSGNTTTVIGTNRLYENDPLVCTFGQANPSYNLSQERFCRQIAPQQVVQEVIKEQKDASQKIDPVDPNTDNNNGQGKGNTQNPIVVVKTDDPWIEQNLLLILIIAGLVVLIAIIIAVTVCIYSCQKAKAAEAQADTPRIAHDQEGRHEDKEHKGGRRRQIKKSTTLMELQNAKEQILRMDSGESALYKNEDLQAGNISISYDADSVGKKSFGLPEQRRIQRIYSERRIPAGQFGRNAYVQDLQASREHRLREQALVNGGQQMVIMRQTSGDDINIDLGNEQMSNVQPLPEHSWKVSDDHTVTANHLGMQATNPNVISAAGRNAMMPLAGSSRQRAGTIQKPHHGSMTQIAGGQTTNMLSPVYLQRNASHSGSSHNGQGRPHQNHQNFISPAPGQEATYPLQYSQDTFENQTSQFQRYQAGSRRPQGPPADADVISQGSGSKVRPYVPQQRNHNATAEPARDAMETIMPGHLVPEVPMSPRDSELPENQLRVPRKENQ